MTKKFIAAAVLASALFVGAGTALADTVYTAPNGVQYRIPDGFQTYAYNTTFYNPATGTYFNSMTGQYSATAPTGPLGLNSSGGYILPAGYTSVSTFGTFYNPSTGLYLDPTTGFTSPSAATGPSVYSVPADGTPGLPNTGAGGDATTTLILLALLGVTTVGSAALLARRRASAA